MNNKTLAFTLVLSTLILPAVASARLTNEVILHTGILATPGVDSITLQQHAGRSITLNKGYMEIKTTKVPMGFSLLDPQLVIKQYGKTMYIDVDTKGYSADEESFTLLAKDSDLNYDLFLRKTITNSKALQNVQVQVCTYKQFGSKCGVDFEGKFNCVMGQVDKMGVQQVRNTTVDVTEMYKLTLGQKNILKAEFISSATRTELKNSEALTVCK